jgi:hypothetical protein
MPWLNWQCKDDMRLNSAHSVLRRIASLACFGIGMFVTYVFYSVSETRNLRHIITLIPLSVAGLCAVLISVFFCSKFKAGVISFILSVVCSYLSYVCLLFAVSGILDDLPGLLMWAPVIARVGIPYMLPLTIMSWLAVCIFFHDAMPREKPLTKEGPNRSAI